jgi:hypothetical protein
MVAPEAHGIIADLVSKEVPLIHDSKDLLHLNGNRYLLRTSGKKTRKAAVVGAAVKIWLKEGFLFSFSGDLLISCVRTSRFRLSKEHLMSATASPIGVELGMTLRRLNEAIPSSKSLPGDNGIHYWLAELRPYGLGTIFEVIATLMMKWLSCALAATALPSASREISSPPRISKW